MATIPIPDLMRQAQTNGITAYLKQQQGSTGLLGPPLQQPPQTDPFTPDPPVTSEPGSWRHTPPVSGTSTAQPSAAWSYEALMRSAGRPIDQQQFTPGSMWYSGENPQLPGDSGPPDPIIEPTPIPGNYEGPPNIGPHPDNLGLDPTNSRNNPFYDWMNYRGSGPQVEVPTGQTPNYSGINSNAPPPVNYTFGVGPNIPGNGGLVGTGTNTTPQEPWYGRVARFLPYVGPVASIIHGVADYNRRHGSGTVGGPAHAVGGNPVLPGGTTSPTQGPLNSSGLTISPDTTGHWDFTRGAYVPNNNATGGQYNTPSSSHTANLQLMASQAFGGQPNRNLVVDSLREARSQAGPGRFYNQPNIPAGGPPLTTNPAAVAAYNAWIGSHGWTHG